MSNISKISKWLGAVSLITIVTTAIAVTAKPLEIWRYRQFVQAVEDQNVRKVSLNPDRTRALVETKNGDRIWVNLINDPELVNLLVRHNVDISVLPATNPPRQNPYSTWRYSEFTQELEQQNVRKVGINADRTRALVETRDGRRVWVNLPNDPNLLDTLVKNEVEIYVLPNLKRSP